jgi:hypothetical protein
LRMIFSIVAASGGYTAADNTEEKTAARAQ